MIFRRDGELPWQTISGMQPQRHFISRMRAVRTTNLPKQIHARFRADMLYLREENVQSYLLLKNININLRDHKGEI